MTAMVCFTAGANTYAIPVSSTLGVRLADTVVKMPSQRVGVIGVLPGDPVLSVVSPLDATGKHILVVTTSSGDYGLLVDEVTDVLDIDDGLVRPAPAGQEQSMIIGVAELHDRQVFLADPSVLGEQL